MISKPIKTKKIMKGEWIISYPEPEDLPQSFDLSIGTQLEFLKDILELLCIDDTDLILNQFKDAFKNNKDVLVEDIIEEITDGKVDTDGKVYWNNDNDVRLSKKVL